MGRVGGEPAGREKESDSKQMDLAKDSEIGRYVKREVRSSYHSRARSKRRTEKPAAETNAVKNINPTRGHGGFPPLWWLLLPASC